MRLATILSFTLLFATVTTITAAQEAKKLKPKELNKVLDKVLEEYAALFNRHDAKALALAYDEKPDVLYTDGVHITSRTKMEASLSDYFKKNPKVQTKFTDVSRKILSQRIVVESATWEEWAHSEEGLPTKGQYACVLMKKKGKWLIVHDRAWAMPEKNAGN